MMHSRSDSINKNNSRAFGSSQSQDRLTGSVGNSIKWRGQVEKDVDILSNRIRLLKKENDRTMKKIEESRKKALEIMRLRQNNISTHNQVIKNFQNKEKQIKEGRKTNIIYL